MSSLSELAPRVRFNEQLLGAVTQGMPDAGWATRPPGGGNDAHWILGHLVASRRLMARLAGAAVTEDPWEAAFGRGATPADDAGAYPPVGELSAAFVAAGEAISERFPALTAAEAAAPSPRPFPDGSDTIEGALHFLYFHETYHLGQLGLLRRMNGLEGFA